MLNHVSIGKKISFLISFLSILAEEVRVELIELLEVCLEADPTQFHFHLGGICQMLGKAG